MSQPTWYEWPFLDEEHRQMAKELSAWCELHLQDIRDNDVFATCRSLVRKLGEGGWLRHCVVSGPGGGYRKSIDVRSLCIARETLARHHALADFAFAMQGLGGGPISLKGTEEQQRRYLAGVARGEKIAAFALSEPEAGSDVAALACSATADGDHFVLNGTKTWISNGGLADFYCVFARTAQDAGARGITAFIVEAGQPGLVIDETISVMSPHPLATLKFQDCRIHKSAMLGELHGGFKLAMQTLDIFRTSVAAAALGFARCALELGVAHASQRRMFGQHLADFQLTQAAFGDIATALDQSALLIYRAGWVHDVQRRSATAEVAMAKMASTESAQTSIDRVLQMFGGKGVVVGQTIERLYRDIRALRIYEGATEVQKLIIGRQVLRELGAGSR